MKTAKNILSIITITALFVMSSFLGQPEIARAAFGLEVRSTNTSNPLATTTTACMTAGTGTTTLALYTGSTDQVDLNILFNASSSPNSILKWRYEESNNAIDWFADSAELVANATTTTLVRDFAEYSWVYASSTGGTSSTNSAFKRVKVKDLATFYWRAVFYVPAGSSPSCIYVQSTLKSANPI